MGSKPSGFRRRAHLSTLAKVGKGRKRGQRRSRFEVRLPGGAVAGAGVHRPISPPCRVGPASRLTPPRCWESWNSLLGQPLMPVHLRPFTRGHYSRTTSSWAYQMLSSKYCNAMPWRWRNMACSFRPSRIADAGPNQHTLVTQPQRLTSRTRAVT